MVVGIGKKIRPKLPHRRATVKPGAGSAPEDPTLAGNNDKNRVIHEDTRRTTKGHQAERVRVNGRYRHETEYQRRCTGCTGFFLDTTRLYSRASANPNRIIAEVSLPCRSVPSCLSWASCASMFNSWSFSMDLPRLLCPLCPTLRCGVWFHQGSVTEPSSQGVQCRSRIP